MISFHQPMEQGKDKIGILWKIPHDVGQNYLSPAPDFKLLLFAKNGLVET